MSTTVPVNDGARGFAKVESRRTIVIDSGVKGESNGIPGRHGDHRRSRSRIYIASDVIGVQVMNRSVAGRQANGRGNHLIDVNKSVKDILQ
jgi:hypothetical protein